MQNEPQPSVKRIYARICIIIGILGIACTYSPLILPVPWKTETKVLLVVIGGLLVATILTLFVTPVFYVAAERLHELRDLGVDQFAVYLQHDAKEETLAAYGSQIIPALT